MQICKNAPLPVHDLDKLYENTVPFCNKGFSELREFYGHLDINYIGQYNDQAQIDLSKFLVPNKVVDIEGDWGYRNLDEKVLSNCICIMNGVKYNYRNYLNHIFVRPTFSKNLMKLVKKKAVYIPSHYRKATFVGFQDPFGIRKRMGELLGESSNFDIQYTDRWKGSSNNESDHAEFERSILSGSFVLCPRGTGVDSVRFLESCAYGRIPIVISDNICFGHDFDLPFYFQFSSMNIDSAIEINKIVSSTPQYIIDQYSKNAVEFFNSYVLDYFDNPTKFFLQWYIKNEKYFNSSIRECK